MQLNGCDAAPPGFVIITFPGSPLHTFFFSLSFVGFDVPGATSKTLIFFGVTPPTVTVAPALMFVPVTSRMNAPDSARSNLHPVTTAMSGVPPPPGVVALAHVNVTWNPCSLPNGHPATAVVMFRLVPPVPTTNTRNVFPAFADVRFTSTSINWHVNGFTCPLADGTNPTVILFAGFARSTNTTLVTVPMMSVVPASCVKQKHAPDISRSCRIPQFPSDGVTLYTTGALVPRFNEHVVVRVNGPKMLLSPAENVVVTVTVAGPPQHASGNAVPGIVASGFNVPLTRLQFNGVTAPNAIVASAIPSPFVSHASVAAVVTVFPGLCSGTPVSVANPWQMIVVSFGKNPHPTRFNCTAHSAFISPVDAGSPVGGTGVVNVPTTTD